MVKFCDFKGPPPLSFFLKIRKKSELRKNERGGPLKSQFFTIFQKRKLMKNQEISEIVISADYSIPRLIDFLDFFRPGSEILQESRNLAKS